MKKIKILSAMIMCMFAFTLTSYAAEDLFYFAEPVVDGTNVAVTLKMNSDAGLTSMSEYSMLYFEIGEGLGYDYESGVTITTDEYKGYFSDEGDSVLSFTYEGTKSFDASSDYAFTLNLKIVDAAKPLTVKLLTDGYITTADGDDYPEYNETIKTISVAGEEPTGTTAKEVKDAGNADKKIAAYDIANDENVKRVLIFTEEQTALTSESRFIVTGEGRTQKFGGDIWDRVGSVEGGGTMKVAKVIFGLIVDASATADDFTFSVGK